MNKNSPIPYAEIEALMKLHARCIKPLKLNGNVNDISKTLTERQALITQFDKERNSFNDKHKVSTIIVKYYKATAYTFRILNCSLDWVYQFDYHYCLYSDYTLYQKMELNVFSTWGEYLFVRSAKIQTPNYSAQANLAIKKYIISFASQPLIPDCESYGYKI